MSHPLLTAPIGRSLLLLAGPTTALMLLQILVAIADGIFVGRLGTDALAGIALVVPFVILMFNVANGGIGGAVASSMARALGRGQLDDARAVVVHSLILAAFFGLLFALLDWACGPWLFQLLGGSGVALERALSFGHVLFTGAITIWVSSFLSALLRGAGDAATPARFGLFGTIAYVPLSGLLTLGAGDWPGFGIIGSAMASIGVTIGIAFFQMRAVRDGRLGFIPTLRGVRVRWSIFQEILRVGIPSSITTALASLTAVMMIGMAGRFGVVALAGYGIGARLEYMVAPVAFGIGSGLTTLVGVAAGANAWRRAVRVAWTGGLTAFVTVGLIGWLVVFFPELWSRLFTSDHQVVAAGTSYIRHVAPFYCLFGLGISLNFASQGAGRMAVPLVASIARLLVATGSGWIVVEKTSLGLDGLFGAIGLGMIVYGCTIGGSLLLAPWGESASSRPATNPSANAIQLRSNRR